MQENRFITPKFEKEQVTKSELAERHPNLFRKFSEVQQAELNGRLYEINNLQVAYSLNTDIFSDNNLPKNKEELNASSLSWQDRNRLEFLHFTPNDYVGITDLIIKSRDGSEYFDLKKEAPNVTIFCKKQGDNIEDSEISYADEVRMGTEINSASGLLALFHELGHIHNKERDISETREVCDEEDKGNIAAKLIEIERRNWAYALQKSRPFLKDMEIDEKDLEGLIHHWALGSHSETMKKYLLSDSTDKDHRP